METYTYQSKSSPGTEYNTVWADDGKLLCDCRGWTMMRGNNPRHCTHTKDFAKKKASQGFVLETRGDYVFLMGPGARVSIPTAPEAREVVARAANVAKRDRLTCPNCTATLEIVGDVIICDTCGSVTRIEAPNAVVPDAVIIRDAERGNAPVGYIVMQDATAEPPPAPMLASPMLDPVAGEDFDARYGQGGWALEEKIDGHRVTIVVTGNRDVIGWSRPQAGADAPNRNNLTPAIIAVMRRFPPGIYDGELCVPGGTSSDVVTKGAELVFMLFDLLQVGYDSWMEQSYADRREGLTLIFRTLVNDGAIAPWCVCLVDSVPPSWETVQAIWARGGEGAVLKQLRSRYAAGYRSESWVKVKTKRAAELTVAGFEEGKSGPFSVICLRDDEGNETTVKTRNARILRAIAADPDAFIGERLVIAYQQRTKAGAYRHGIFDHFTTGPLS